MPNVLDIGPVNALAARTSRPITNPTVAKRYTKLASERILRNPRCFRPATEAEMVGSDLVSDEDDDPADTAHAKALIRVKTWARICTNSGSVLVAI